MSPDGFLGRRALILVAVGLTVGEDVLLQAFGLSGATALSLQVAAPPPLGVFHDLRWLMVFHDSYATFAGLVAALFVFRTIVTVVLVLLAWPRGVPRPGALVIAATAAAATALGLVVLTPAATLLFTMGFAPLFYFFLVALLLALPFVLLLPHSGFPCRWWRRLPPLRAVAWIALDGVVLTIASLALVEAPAWVNVLPAALGGLFNALCWYAIAHETAAGRRAPVDLKPSALAVLAGVLAAGAASGSRSGCEARVGRRPPPPPAGESSSSTRRASGARGTGVPGSGWTACGCADSPTPGSGRAGRCRTARGTPTRRSPTRRASSPARCSRSTGGAGGRWRCSASARGRWWRSTTC
ncbi:MAG TPA: hypothetical protein VFI37_13055 [Gaiellaceae bacterium]|nr:hypothetical protein [Gaiellaceae bacterium]